MKLIKVDDIYTLMDGEKMIASSDSDFQTDYEVMKLSKQNCDEIFGVVDVEKLADEYIVIKPKHREHEHNLAVSAYIEGFNKAMELNKDKLFTEDQMWNMFYFGDSLKSKIKSGTIDNKPMGEIFDDYIQSLQQPTEMDVEIEMTEDYLTWKKSDIEKLSDCLIPKLDENGCLILTKKK